MITTKQRRALEILSLHPGITAGQFAGLYYTDPKYQYLFTAVVNQGNGACAGKKAWLCAGSLLGKLSKRGWVWCDIRKGSTMRFRLTAAGKEILEQ